MASKKPNAPVCRDCGRSNDIEVEVSVAIVWRQGAWRWANDPEAALETGGGDFMCTTCASMDIALAD